MLYVCIVCGGAGVNNSNHDISELECIYCESSHQKQEKETEKETDKKTEKEKEKKKKKEKEKEKERKLAAVPL